MNKSTFQPDLSIDIHLENLNDIDFMSRKGSILEICDKNNQLLFGFGFPNVVNTAVYTQGQLVAFVNSDLIDNPLKKYKIIENPFADRSLGTLLHCALGKVSLTDYHYKQYSVVLEKNGNSFSSQTNNYYYRAQIYKGKEIRYWDNKIRYNQRNIEEVFSKNISIYTMSIINDFAFFNTYDEEKKQFNLQARKINVHDLTIDKKTIIIKNYKSNEYVYSYGFLKGKALFATNLGNLYSVSMRSLDCEEDFIAEKISSNQEGKSFQFYSMLNFYDKILLGQYPTGNIFLYDGEVLTQLDNVPGILNGYPNKGREVQTLYPAGGKILAGVWPWAELWKIDNNLSNSHFIQRLVQKPENKTFAEHPYEYFVKNYDYNVLGQRITGILGYKNYIYVSTSNKNGKKYNTTDLIEEIEMIDEYGDVTVFETKSDFFVPMGQEGLLEKNGTQKINLEFYTKKEKNQGKVKIFMNEKYVGKIDSCFPVDKVLNIKITPGNGMFGKYDGKISALNITP